MGRTSTKLLQHIEYACVSLSGPTNHLSCVVLATIPAESRSAAKQGLEDRLQHLHQETFTEAYDGEHTSALGHCIDGIDVITPLDAIQSALVSHIQA